MEKNFILYAMLLVREKDGLIMDVVDIFSSQREAEIFLKAVQENRREDWSSSGYAHQYREVEIVLI